MSTIGAIIAEQPFFNGLSSDQLRTLAESAMRTWFESGEVIFREGDVANRLYLIVEGKVALEFPGESGPVSTLQTIGPGELLGWSWMMSTYIGRLQARAVEPTEAIFFYGTRLREQCAEDRNLGYELFKRIAEVMMRRLEMARQQVSDCRTLDRKTTCRRRSGGRGLRTAEK